ncbi:ferredoxin--NADP reductase [Oligoflexus tunisiensis]|uniref:ferredoxin--NADP reductase n=1 Tax=Oligoflexus tunisiensis TaxID=708132 RepID=UPI00114D0471|nr:FAD-dependent oxidoreductase [Oligoflexus tunisiensis]
MKTKGREFRASVRRIEYVGRRYAIIEAQGTPDFNHSPGQFIKIAFVDKQGTFERYYSIASAPRNDHSFELCIILDDERTRDLVTAWAPGSTLICSAPSGRFTNPPKDQPVVCVAGGSGITPLKAIIEDRLEHGPSAATVLLYGCQSDTEIPFFEALQSLGREHPSFQLQIFADNISMGQALAGRPLDQLEHFILPDAHYLLCGPPGFMEAARRLLVERGVRADAIHQDRY